MPHGAFANPGYVATRLKSPFTIDHPDVRHLLVHTYFNGDQIDRAVYSACTGNIAGVRATEDLLHSEKVTLFRFRDLAPLLLLFC